MTERSPTRVATFDDPVIAHIARSKLESHGILATLDGEYHVAMDWMVSNAVGGIKLLVAKQDVQEAVRILELKPEQPPSKDRPSIAVNEQCPRCHSGETSEVRLNRKIAFLSLLLLGFPIPFFSRKMVCRQCDFEWKTKS